MLEEDERYFESKRFKRLLGRYEEAMKQTGNIYLEPDELTDIAEYYAMQDRMDEANEAIDLALALHPGSVDPQVFLARQQMFFGNNDEAHRLCEAIDEQDDREVLFLRAELMLNEGKFDDAYRFLENTYRHLPDEEEPDMFLYDSAALLFDYAAWDETLRMLDTLRSNFPQMVKAERLYIRTIAETGNHQLTIQLADEFLDKNPYDIDMWTIKGEAYAELNDLEQANEAADYALAINPEDPRAQVLSGNCHFHLGNYQEALDVFAQYLRNYPQEASAHYLSSLCLAALKQYQEAADEIELVDMTSPSITSMRDGIYLHRAHTEAHLGHIDNALHFLSLLEETATTTDIDFEMHRGYLYLYCNDIDNAMLHMRTALLAMPPIQLAFDAPLQCIETNHLSEAIQLLNLMDQIYEHDEERERIAPMLAHCYYQTGNRMAFLTTFQRAIMNEPELTADVFRIELPHTNDKQELYRSACIQVMASNPKPPSDN